MPASPRPSGNGSAQDPNTSTTAAFSPFSPTTSNRQRSAILVQQKSPLLVATPPQITRALAFSHPFILSLNKVAGLLTWTSGEPWESFLLLAGVWGVIMYGDALIRWAGPLILVAALILGMYSRRYSPLSSTGWTGEKVKGQKREGSECNMRHQKSLDEIVETLEVFTSRCNILLEPFLQLTDYLSTQRSATSATTRPALTSLFLRILMITPMWIALTIKPIEIVTTRRTIFAISTCVLSWHSRPARVTRMILWRSRSVRFLTSLVTGLEFDSTSETQDIKGVPPPLPPRNKSQHDAANTLALNTKTASPGARFTFVVYENQRRWLGLGWTSSMFAYERPAWTDDHLNPSASKDDFLLPEVEHGSSRWRWVEGSEWRVEGNRKGSKPDGGDWIYYDNKWNDGRRGQDGWGRYTRRRKWYRDAELVEASASPVEVRTETTQKKPPTTPSKPDGTNPMSSDRNNVIDDGDDHSSQTKKRGFFRRASKGSTTGSGQSSGKNVIHSDTEPEAPHVHGEQEQMNDWNMGEDMKMGLG